MKLREKTVLTIALTFIGLILGLYLITDHVVMKGFNRVEKDLTCQNLQQVLNEIDDKIIELDERNVDWSRWDETYNYILNRDKGYFSLNLSDDNYTKTLKVNFILFLDKDGNMVYPFGFDLVNTKIVPVSRSVTAAFEKNPDLIFHRDNNSKVRGVLMLTDGPPIIFTSRPIVKSDGKGPIVGTLVFGRYLNQREVGLIEAKFRTKLTIIPKYKNNAGNEEFKRLLAGFTDAEMMRAEPFSRDYIAGYTVINDYTGKPVMVLSLVNKRTVYQKGRESMQYLFGMLCFACIVFGLATLIMTERVITSRLMKLNESVKTITRTESAGGGVRIPGKDEISSLSLEIDRMLERIRDSQESLREKDKELRNLIENANVGIVRIAMEPGCPVLEANSALLKMLGYQSETELKDMTFASVISDAEESKTVTREILDGIYPWNREIPLSKKDGQTIWAMCKFGGGVKRGGQNRWVDGIIQDITRDKTIKTLLMDKNRELNEFAYTVSHDLKNPLNILEGYLMAIKGNPGLFETYFDKVIRQADRLIALINNLLNLSRAGQAIGEKRRIVLEDMIAQVFIMTKPQDVSAKLAVESRGTPLDCDISRMQQVFENLVSNSIRYRDGEKEKLIITFRAERVMDRIKITYEDNGSGIKDEFLDKIFKSGFTTAINIGTGLGLAIVKKIVEAHMGTINVESNGPGKGTRFIITFPDDSAKVSGELLNGQSGDMPDPDIPEDNNQKDDKSEENINKLSANEAD